MAYHDYIHCRVCDAKALYSADIDWRNVGAIVVLCKDCSAKHVIAIQDRKELQKLLDGLDAVFGELK